MSRPTASIDQIARSLDGVVPHWLPAYDPNIYAAKVDAACGCHRPRQQVDDPQPRILGRYFSNAELWDSGENTTNQE
jgi:hypothetical protein